MRRTMLLTIAAGMLLAMTAGVAVAATLNGAAKNDAIKGTNNDVINGRGGNDRLYGLGHDDRIDGGAGNDRLYGAGGNDKLEGAIGNDLLNAGNDRATDYVYCGAGDDTVRIKANDVVDANISGQSLLASLNNVTSCETLVVNDIRIPNPVTTK